MSTLSRDDILKANDLTTEAVEVPEWGGEVLVKGMTSESRDFYEQELNKSKGGDEDANMVNIRATVCSVTIVDNEGNLIFTKDDIASLGKKSAAALDRVFDVAQRLSGIGQYDLKDLAKN